MAKIEIPTTQHVIIQYETAGFLWRAIAWSIDFFIFNTVIFLALNFMPNWLSSLLGLSFNFFELLAYFILYFSLFILVQLFIEKRLNGQSIGKKVVGIKIISLDGNSMDFYKYFVRCMYNYFDIYFSFFSVGSLLILMSEKNQRLGDMVTNVTVVRLKPDRVVTLTDLLNLPDKDEYIPKYPQVVHYTDKEMLALKTLLIRTQQFNTDVYQILLHDTVEQLKQQMDILAQDSNQSDADFLREIISEYVILTR
ncbi:MAG TPA: RDD family protein [Chitinophagales bacterium]|nr:RDD family protein [Chitinophagales bacterium]